MIPSVMLRDRAHDSRVLMDFLRASTYGLSPRPLGDLTYGYDFGLKDRVAEDGGRHLR